MKIIELLKDNHRIVLTSITISEVIFTGYLWYKSGIKASKVLEKKKEEKDLCDQNDKEALRAVKNETIKEMAPIVALPVIATGLTIGTVIFSHKINEKDLLVVSSAYIVARDKLREKNDKVLEMLGEKKSKEIDGAIMTDRVQNDPDPINITVTKYGDTLCKDFYSGRYFTSSPQHLQQCILEISSRLQSEMWISLNDFYYIVGLDPIPLGDDLGFNVERTIRGQIPITTSAVLNKYNNPCFCMEYDVDVRQRYLLESRS